MASLFLGIYLGSDEDDDYVFGAALQKPQQKEDTGDETEADEGDEDHEADTLGKGGLGCAEQQQNELDFWNAMKAGTDVGKGPSVGNDGS